MAIFCVLCKISASSNEEDFVNLFSDPAMKQFLLHLDEKLLLGRKFIIQDLDETHVFVSPDIIETLQVKIDDLMDRISFPLHEKEA